MNYTTSERNVAVDIRMGTDPMNSSTPVTVPWVLEQAAKKCGDQLALSVQRSVLPMPKGKWETWTYNEYLRDVRRAAKSIIQIGMPQYGAVNILGFNSPEWTIADLGAIFAGGVAAGIYSTNSPVATRFVAVDSDATVLFVENDIQLEKYISNLNELPSVKAIVVWNAKDTRRFSKDRYNVPVYSWKSFLALGDEVTDDVLDARIQAQKPGNCCTLVYTSGTTSVPKAVMLSHDAMTSQVKRAVEILRKEWQWGKTPGGERSISFLPMSHVASQMLDLHGPLALPAHHGIAHAVYYARPDALKGSLKETLAIVRPTGFFAVPRVFEKFLEAIKEQGGKASGIKKKVATWARAIGAQVFAQQEHGSTTKKPCGYGIANSLVFSKVLDKLGLDQAYLVMSGAAPLSPDVQGVLGSLGLTINEGYGLSECASVATLSRPSNFKPGSVGGVIDGTEIKIADPDDKGEGEIRLRGRHIHMGYLDSPEKTAEGFDEDGFLRTGDIGKIDKHSGLLFVTGRIKDLIITAGGENVPPTPIEDALKSNGGMISNAVVVGDKRKFLTVLLTLKTAPDSKLDMAFTNELFGAAKRIIKNVNTVAEAKASTQYMGLIEDVLKWYNASARCTSNAQKIQYFYVLDNELSVHGESAEMTATLKVKRNVVLNKYADAIELMYTPDYASVKQEVKPSSKSVD